MLGTNEMPLTIVSAAEKRYNGRIAVGLGPLHNERLKKIPGTTYWRKGSCWTLPLAWTSVLMLGSLAKEIKHQIRPSKELAAWVVQAKQEWAELAARSSVLSIESDEPDGLFAHQRADIEWLAYDGATRGRLLLNEMGCLAGDTMINVNRAGKGSRMRLDWIVSQMGTEYRGQGTGTWRPDIPTRVARAELDGSIRLATVVNAWASGTKETYEVITESGRSIRATDEHPFLTVDGWARLDQLSVGLPVMVNTGRSLRKPQTKKAYRTVGGMAAHPYVVWMGARPTVLEHRLVAEAGINGLDPQVFIDKVTQGHVEGFVFLDPAEFAVHHLDRDHRNNDPNNLAVLTHEAHTALHSREDSGTARVLEHTGTEKIVSIAKFGEEMTYDIEVADDPHNFLANGFVVHNTGKTRSVIMTLAALKLAGAFPALVVCPKIVSHRGWSDEWATADPDVRVMVAEGTLPNRRKAIKAVANGEADVLVIGYESMRGHTRYEGYGSIALKRCPSCHGPTIETATEDSPLIPESKCQAHPKELNQIEWKAIILDEAHRALNASSQTRMALSGVVNYTGPDTRRWLITGTPVSKDPDGIWSLLHIADPECWPVRGTWVNRYCEKGFNSGGFEVVIGYDTTYETEFRKSFDAISRRVLKEMVLDLPDILRGTTLVHEVEMGTEQRKLYEAMRDEMIVQLKEGTLLAANAAVQVGRLTLLASAAGFPGDTPGEMLLRAPSCKIDELVEMIKNKELPDSWCAAFTSRRMLRLTVAELVKKGLFEEWQIGIIDGGATDADRNLAVKRFQGGDIPVVFYTHAAGGIGITLHRAETLVLVERHWSNNIMLQSLARVHRAGMPDRPVSVVDIITRNTVEERQLNRLQQDADLLEWVVQDQQRLEEFLRLGDVVEAVPALT